MKEKIIARIDELKRIKDEAETRLIVINNLINELTTLIEEKPIMSGDPLEETPA